MFKSNPIEAKNDPAASIPWRILAIACIIGFGFSGMRHFMMQSEAWDLGIFDQAVYLISQGQTPFSTLLRFHILGDHAAVIFYPIALLYKIYPSVYWLLFIQTIALVIGGWIVRELALQAKITPKWATLLMGVYLLYPLTFNANIADFHPETIAVPAFLGAVWFARAQRLWQFCICVAIILSCRDALGLSVAAMGIWLWLCEDRRVYGAIALLAGISWFVIATQVIIPSAEGGVSIDRFLFRYAHLGSSYSEIAKNLIFNPLLFLKTLFTFRNFEYIVLIFAPIVWASHPRNWLPLVAAVPTLAMNMLSQEDGQRTLTDQYALPLLPFLMLIAIATVANPPKWLPSRRAILAWSIVGLFILGKYGYFTFYIRRMDTWAASRAAIALIREDDRVLADARLVPHLSHRKVIEQLGRQQLEPYDAVLINAKRVWAVRRSMSEAEIQQLQQTYGLKQVFAQDGIVLLHR
ncbi:DUF2079 domain-containing protein [Leptolyngbya sp. FACHB-17]|uniref:DUF2079 domain-containing protein n=1 Tax=unclassified Leptolyngbya TaxID=2650499 RepID=UPI0019A3FF35|nr:DUF2079 domain-containing protein [Leptolyngbya sp. FACHB-17]MBD2080322.1 DUF2079 domain-containing protein [Leptolyngbya sp. FACHB-17]